MGGGGQFPAPSKDDNKLSAVVAYLESQGEMLNEGAPAIDDSSKQLAVLVGAGLLWVASFHVRESSAPVGSISHDHFNARGHSLQREGLHVDRPGNPAPSRPYGWKPRDSKMWTS